MKLGVDLGGTKIEAIVLSEEGQALWRKRVATPQQNYHATLGTIRDLVNTAKSAFSLSSSHPVGIGTPGALFIDQRTHKYVLKNSNSTALNGQPFLDDLQASLACEVYIENDANCFALAEACSGQGLQFDGLAKTVFGVILGTGVGGGIVIEQKVLKGRHRIAGEWGHNTLPSSALLSLPASEKNRACYCGRQDCIETYLSGPGLAQSYFLRFGDTKSPQDIINGLSSGNSEMQAIWERYIEQLAASLGQVVNILDPDLIVLGGGLSNIQEIYAPLSEKIHHYVFTENFSTPILPAKLGDSAGVFGAAWLTAR